MTTDPQTELRDRIAAATIPLLLDTLPKVIARARGYEVADAVLAVLPAPVDRGAVVAEVIARITGMPGYPRLVLPEEIVAELRRLADEEQPAKPDRCPHGCDTSICPCLACEADEAQQPETQAFTVQVWPLTRVLTDVRCGSQDWTWDEEWADLDRRHSETGYLAKLEQEIRANGITMPVLIGTDGRLWDGHHRLRIAVRLGIDYVPVEVPAAVAQPGKET